MNKNKFRILLVLSIIISALVLGVEFIFPNPEVDAANDFIIQQESLSEESSLNSFLLLTAAAVVSVLVIAAYIGLFLFKKWGRTLFVASFVIALPTYFIGGLYVTSGLEDFFYDISTMLNGALVALMYCTPVKQLFEEPQI